MSYEGDNGYSALVAEVDVDRGTGKIDVKHIFVCVDCGPVSNPEGLKNQTSGSELQGMSRALLEEVTWDDQKVTSFGQLVHLPDLALRLLRSRGSSRDH